MRQIWTAVAVALLVGMVVTPASAGGDITVQDEVERGDRLQVVAKHCISGEGYTAWVEVTITNPTTDGPRLKDVPADADGTTKVRIRVPAAWPAGRGNANVTCAHRFDNGKVGQYYSENERFRIVERQ